ncbi:von Willebrand factor type A domain-containing protein [Bacteroides sp. OttesenSCG-928-D19]|nr:von Willebrand factor type A domain-containing protein [Bacteroides sp. OttesenSCG-928-N06]MDL2304749.1 von Willebrand factor type A domain-containing protein [Bacteroides sp. OttesenSCG-928-D19]
MKKIVSKTSMMAVLMLLISMSNAMAQAMIVKGKVKDAADGSPIVSCTVLVKGTSNGTTTDANGQYTITTTKGATLVFSYIGFETQEVKVKGNTLNVSMQQDNAVLSEVVVTSYCHVKHALTGAVSGLHITRQYEALNTEEYSSASENRFKTAVKDPLSTFSIDVDAASYSNMRRFINQGNMPPADAIRTEELINYFTYNYRKPTGKDPVSISTEVGNCPWNAKHRLVRIGIKAKEIAGDELPASNLVFLIDVSGSMYGPTRLELVKSSLKLLINNLREKDRVAIVVYSGSAGEVLPSTSGADKQKIREALDNLTAGGSTAGGAGIRLAYQIARNNFVKDGNNRIILCTDGDFNVGVSSTDGLEKLIEQERKSGVFLTVLGYGMGNYKDNRMQTLAEKGNGNHAYIDNMQEANKVLVQEFGGTMYTVAKDVKLQIEFNPAQVQAYRLIGYESRLLNNEDFNDDTKDAGEMGAGHTVTAFYEVIPTGIESNWVGKIDELKYQKKEPKKEITNTGSKELLTIKLRYKDPNGAASKKMELPVMDNKGNNASADFRFAAAVAMFGQLLRNSDYKGDATHDKVITLAKSALGDDEQGYRREFVRLVQTVAGMAH